MIRHLCDLGETYDEANAVRFVREMMSMGLQEEDKGLQELPSYFTKRKLYKLWVSGWGWRITSSNNGAYPPLAKSPPRAFDDDWSEGYIPLPVCR
jgi:hypothetical protein